MLHFPKSAKGSRSLGTIVHVINKTMADDTPHTKRFAPLDPAKSRSSAPRLKGIVFDVDGTLW